MTKAMTPDSAAHETRRAGLILTASLVASVLSLFLFAWIADLMIRGATSQFDDSVRSALHSLATPALTDFFRIVTWLGSSIFLTTLTVIVALLLRRAGKRHRAILVVVSFLGSSLLMEMLKLAFHRPRPAPYFGYTLPLSYSFPSGHSLMSFCTYSVLAAFATVYEEQWTRRVVLWLLTVALILLIGMSRIYLGVHYPSDVLAGYIAGLFWVSGIYYAYRHWRNQPVP